MNEFYVGGYRVDMSRSQIVAQEHIVSMEPKVLQVLLILAKNQGEVVPHETILTQVWPDVVVAPNALQRCIAQLRKAFGDDAKTQKVIATHPKVGYSLLADVDFQVSVPEAKEVNSASATSKQPHRWFALAAVLVVFIVVAGVGFFQQDEALPLTRLTALTTTDNREFYPAFSPDGRHIAFQRFLSACDSQIWVKDLDQNREFLLTKDIKVYGPPAWSPDGSQLAFWQMDECVEKQPTKGCRSMQTISFDLAKASAQPTREILACGDYDIGGVSWMADDKIIYKASNALEGEVRTLDLSDGKVTTLFKKEGFKPYALSYSMHLGKLSLTGTNDQQNPQWLLVDGNTGEYEQVDWQLPELYQAVNTWDPYWHPNEAFLLVSVASTLFKLTTDGVFSEFPVPTMHEIYTPVFHPDGDKIAATMGTLDYDFGQINGFNIHEGPLKGELLNRSIVEDYHGQFQPGTDNISFASKRSGTEQIWFDEQGRLRQLSQLKQGEMLDSYLWAADGSYILMNVNSRLQLLHLDGQAQVLPTAFQVVRIYQWLDEQVVLLNVVEQGQYKVIKFDMQSRQYQEVYNGFTVWAQFDENDQLYLLDDNEKIKRLDGENANILPLSEDLLIWSGFYFHQGHLYVVDINGQMWVFDLAGQSKRKIAVEGVGEHYWRIDDIDLDRGRLLYSFVHQARKEIVLFH